MGRRYRINGAYVERDRYGQFKRWSSVGRSTATDRRQYAKKRPKRSGYGHQGDYRKRRGRPSYRRTGGIYGAIRSMPF